MATRESRWRLNAEIVLAREGVDGLRRRLRDAVVAEDRKYALFLEAVIKEVEGE